MTALIQSDSSMTTSISFVFLSYNDHIQIDQYMVFCGNKLGQKALHNLLFKIKFVFIEVYLQYEPVLGDGLAS